MLVNFFVAQATKSEFIKSLFTLDHDVFGKTHYRNVYEDEEKQKFFEIGNNKKVPFEELTVGQLAGHIARKGKFESDISNLWKVDVDKSKLNPGSTKEDIEKLGGESMEFEYDFIYYFRENYKPTRNKIHIVAVIATTTTGPSQQGAEQGPNWNDPSSIYEWIKQSFTLNRGRNRLVESFGATFELLQRKDTIDTLWNDIPSEQLNGIVNRFEIRESDDKTDNPIPILAGGPGIGKSRFLDEIERLLKQCDKGSSNKDLCDAIANMVVINVTYGNASSTDTIDLKAGGPASFAMRILFEYFRPHRTYDEDSIKIGKSLDLFDDKYFTCHPYFRICIGDLGGHVKSLEYFYRKFEEYLEQCERNPYQVKIEDVIISVKCTIESKYQLSLNSKWLKEPLTKAILGIPVDKYDVIKIGENEMSYQELSSKGVVNLFDYYEPMYWQNFEDFNAKFWALRLSLFRLLGYKKIKLGELLNGAKFSRGFPEEAEIVLPEDTKLCKLRHGYPATETNENKNMNGMEESFRCYTKLDCLKNEDIKNEKYMDFVFLNAPGAPWDVFNFLNYESSETGIFCVARQIKYTNIETMIIDQDSFNDEYERVSKAIKDVPIDNWALLFLTNAESRESLNITCKNNSALVSRKQFQDFYGFTYASRAQFASVS
ncbi:hypothetical protein GLOIN_2v1592612 [Rhizophagus clarus]|uniref:Crinkler effector protein N-terminal domain-containing protein n=1 Tax=Rhizophagus clarus TaxID=94130 RepID=A0A8H3LTT8_9GLOM|nr:hypothetical protein GLOIN_2v1592612 [Rhizophagus clarus]